MADGGCSGEEGAAAEKADRRPLRVTGARRGPIVAARRRTHHPGQTLLVHSQGEGGDLGAAQGYPKRHPAAQIGIGNDRHVAARRAVGVGRKHRSRVAVGQGQGYARGLARRHAAVAAQRRPATRCAAPLADRQAARQPRSGVHIGKRKVEVAVCRHRKCRPADDAGRGGAKAPHWGPAAAESRGQGREARLRPWMGVMVSGRWTGLSHGWQAQRGRATGGSCCCDPMWADGGWHNTGSA